MARKLFEFRATRRRGGTLADAIEYIVWDDEAATVLADISASSGGSSIAGSSVITADIAGLGPAACRFYGPTDDQDTLWVTCPSDASLGVQKVDAQVDARLDALEAGSGGAHPNLATHDALGLATDAELTTHAADTTAVHGIPDTAQVALRNAANTFTADNLFRSGRPWVDVRAYGTNTAAIDAAGAAAFAANAPLYFPPGTDYAYSGTGLTPTDGFVILGAGPEVVSITLGASSYLLAPSAALYYCHVSGFTTVGGKGLYKHSHTGVQVSGHHVFEDLRIVDFTECAISNNASDMPYFRFLDVQIQGANSTGTIGIAMSGLLNCTTFERCTILKTRIGVKIRTGTSVYLDKCEFINFDAGGASPRARIWVVPSILAVSGQGTVIRDSEFGNENRAATDYDVLFADEDTTAGSDNATYMPKLSTDSTGYITGIEMAGCRIAQASGAGPRPVIYSTTPNVLGCLVHDNYLDSPPSYLLEFRTPPDNDRLSTTNRFGPNRSYDVGTEQVGLPVSNAAYVGAVVDPQGQFDMAVGKGFSAIPGGLNPTGYVNLLTTKIRSFANPFGLTLTNVTDALGGDDATEVTYTSATTITANPAVTPTSGKPMFVEFDLKPGSSSPLSKVLFTFEDYSSGKILMRRFLKPPAAGWSRYRLPLIVGTGTATMFVQFATVTGDAGKLQIGRVRIYHANEPLNVDGAFPGGLVTGLAALSTTATDGFLYVPSCPGPPTGVPVAKPGMVPLVWDSTNHELYVYSGGWKGGTAPGTFT